MYGWAEKNQRLDLVEGSTLSKTEKKTALRRGAGNVKLPATHHYGGK
jgi:hypothetical protein